MSVISSNNEGHSTVIRLFASVPLNVRQRQGLFLNQENTAVTKLVLDNNMMDVKSAQYIACLLADNEWIASLASQMSGIPEFIISIRCDCPRGKIIDSESATKAAIATSRFS